MTENNKNRFTDNETDCLIDSSFTDNLTKKIYGIDEWERIIGLCNNLWEQTVRFEKYNQDYMKENKQLTQQLSDIKGQLVMLDNCDNWDYDRMKHTVREIAEIIGYNGTINPKR